MTYVYELNNKMIEKYNITSVVVNGWHGINDKYNEYWDDRKPVYQQRLKGLSFKESEIDEMLKNPKSYKEYN